MSSTGLLAATLRASTDEELVRGLNLREVTGSGNDLMVNGAKVICGGVHTANATVYLIDTVLMPKM